MNSREKVSLVFDRKNTSERTAWMGTPTNEIIEACAVEWGLENTWDAVSAFFGDDCSWLYFRDNSYYFHPNGLNTPGIGAGSACFCPATFTDIQ